MFQIFGNKVQVVNLVQIKSSWYHLKVFYTKLKHKYEINLAFSIWSYELRIVAKGKVRNQIDNLTFNL
jgi:hypothetical protein